MKLMVCANLDVGGLPGIDMASARIAKWETDKIEALAAALDDAANRGADACIIAGGLFAKGFVPQSLLTETLEEAGSHDIPVCFIPIPGELADAGGRIPEVEGISIVMPSRAGKTDVALNGGKLTVPVVDGTGLVEIEDITRPAGPICVLRNRNEIGVSLAGSSFRRLGPLEPSSFGDPQKSGYLLVHIDGSDVSGEWVEMAQHPFVIHEVSLDGLGKKSEMIAAIGNSAKGIDRNACLRVELKGRIPLGAYLNTSDLAEQLGRHFFYAEVADECTLDIDVAGLGTDVSLLGEFVRQVSGDDSLSATEKTRILRCGWNAINGKELAE